MSLLSVKNIDISYGGMPAVVDASFDLKEGEFLSVVGANGSGKSTLIKAILGLKKIDSGSIEYREDFCKSDIGYIAQMKEMKLDFPSSVYEVVLSGFISKLRLPFYSKKHKERAGEIMAELGILELKHRGFTELSGGQRQKVLLARALCSGDRLLILDEPVNALDPYARESFYREVTELNKKSNLTIIMVTHDIEKSLALSDRILHMGKKVLFFGSAREYRESDVFIREEVGRCL